MYVKLDLGKNQPIIFGVMALFQLKKNGFHSITFEKISELDSYFIHIHIIIKYRSSLI